MSRVVQTPSKWSTPDADCTDGRCQWDTTGSASVEDAPRDHFERTGHTVVVNRTLRYTFQR
jgi:hypothetical protein